MKLAQSLKLTALALAANMPEGFTFNPTTGRLVKSGYVVAAAETQDCIGKAGLYKVVKFCLNHKGFCLGGWRNETGAMQFDASRVYNSLEEAIAAAVENKQRAIYNLYTGKEIPASDFSTYLRIAA